MHCLKQAGATCTVSRILFMEVHVLILEDSIVLEYYSEYSLIRHNWLGPHFGGLMIWQIINNLVFSATLSTILMALYIDNSKIQ